MVMSQRRPYIKIILFKTMLLIFVPFTLALDVSQQEVVCFSKSKLPFIEAFCGCFSECIHL